MDLHNASLKTKAKSLPDPRFYSFANKEIKQVVEKLARDNLLDHTMMIQDINGLVIFNLNIAQLNDMKLSKRGWFQEYLRTRNALGRMALYKSKQLNFLKMISALLYKKTEDNLVLREEFVGTEEIGIKPTSKLGIAILKICKDFKFDIPIEMKLTRNKILNTKLFPEGTAVSMVFYRESENAYKKRIWNILRQIFIAVRKYYGSESTILFCLQEISPIKSFLEVFDTLKDEFGLICSHIMDHVDETNSIIIHSENVTVSQLEDVDYESNLLLKKLSYKKGGRQNTKNLVTWGDNSMALYNVHTNYYPEEKAVDFLKSLNLNECTSATAIVGDMNLKLSDENKQIIIDYMEQNNIFCKLEITPEVNFEGIETNPTYDVIFASKI